MLKTRKYTMRPSVKKLSSEVELGAGTCEEADLSVDQTFNEEDEDEETNENDKDNKASMHASTKKHSSI